MSPWIALGALSAAFLAGGYAHHRWTEAAPVKAALKASEEVREVEHEKAVVTVKKLDTYAKAQEVNKFTAVRTAGLVVSLQHDIASISASPASGASSGCDADPRLRAVADLLSEGVSLVAEGQGHVNDLVAKRDAMK